MTAQETAPKTRAALPATLEKPGIRQSLDGINLDPMAVHTTGRLTALIERLSQGLLETDTFFVEVTGWNVAESRGSYKSPVLGFGPPTLRTLNLEPKLVAFNLRQKIKVEYTVNRDGETSVTSGELELNVLDLAPEELKAGVIFGKDDDGTGPVLDLTIDTEDRTVRVELWPLIAEGQWCWIGLKGKKAEGSDYELTLFKGQVDAAWITLGCIKVSVPYSELRLLSNGSVLTLEYKVAFDQVDDQTRAHSSMARSYTVKMSLARPHITTVMDSKGNLVANTWATLDTRVTLKGTVPIMEDEVDIYEGEILLGGARTTGTQWEYATNELNVGRYSFQARERDGVQRSDSWTVTVGAPYIDRASIPNGAESSDGFVSFWGKAKPEQTFLLYKNGNFLRSVKATPDGDWSDGSTLTPRANVFAVGVQGATIKSPEWTVYHFDPENPLP